MRQPWMRLVVLAAGSLLLIVGVATAVQSGAFASMFVNPLVQQIESEQRAISVRFNADRRELAATIEDFTGNEPVEVVRLDDGGVIVINDRGEEWFLPFGEESPAVGEVRWVTMGEEGAAIGPVATPSEQHPVP